MEQIPKKLNKNVDALARHASAIYSELSRLILIELLNEPSTNVTKQVLTIQSNKYLDCTDSQVPKDNGLLNNQLEAQRM